ncbi:ABC transporter permease [Brevibacillus massiliensis]|jgi:putative ABC transport system permease protein|uniref:ABC transporter permease n=1 Tax=Brevibacillus massiliensis TaxID=1118054 RepID=UPI000318F8D0|nr:ABC transporter permease [Brevibacillus massiliensis]
MGFAINGAIEQGLLYAIMALGVYISFRILNFPDLTVDGSFALGGAVAAKLILDGYSPFLAMLVALLAGAVAGFLTGLMSTKGKINGLLAGILSMIGLWSINLRIMGDSSNLALLRETTLVTMVEDLHVPDLVIGGVTIITGVAIVFLVVILIVKLLIDWFLHTDLGLDVRATGDNATMIRSFGANTDRTTIIGLALSNALVACSGAWIAQYQGFADVGMGVGMIVIGLASVIVGEVLFGRPTIMRATLAVIGGSLVYRLVIAFALRAGLKTSDMKLVTALIVILALTLPNLLKGVIKKSKNNGKGGTS